MAKTLISFLGTGPAEKSDGTKIREYRKAKYSIDGKVIGESSFVSSILMDHFQFDNLILIGTVKSMWEAVYHYYCEKNNVEFNWETYANLEEVIENANHQTSTQILDLTQVKTVLGENSDAILIPYGLNREEQVKIFSAIEHALNHFQDGDEIILDVTHSFRSLPLFTTSIINYIQSLTYKNIKFEKVYYGMLDAMREFDGIAPIVDISTAVELQKWTTAAYSFKEYGKGKLLADLLGGDEGDMIKIFSDAVNINYLNEIKARLTNFQQFSQKKLGNEFAQWVVPEVLASFAKRLQKVGGSNWKFQFELSQWHYERENFSSAYIVFVESILTFVCEHNGWKLDEKPKREAAKKLIIEKDFLNLKAIYTQANKPRNNIAHNLNSRVNRTNTDIQNLGKMLKKFSKIVN